ncbi:YceI family protein [Oceaniglobus indicus]|uniref:YceI family protein n=1 Tax=Oceaniglobus indicus TaxID=2047749 RepID=UPI000C1801E2|nr:YceI family protein [Oceaniglobus indicus]
MKTKISVALVLSGLALPALAEPQRYELDPVHTTVSFLVDHVGYAGTLGLFASVEGAFTFDMDTQTLSDLEVRVMTDSVITLNDARDKHVRSKDFLNVGAHPVMTFSASEGHATDATSGSVTGSLTLLGETRPLTLEVWLNKAEPYPFGHKRFVLGISARGTLQRSDYGMTYGVDNGLVGDTVDLIIETEAMRIE